MLRCIIIDEESQAVQSLRNFIEKIPYLEFADSFTNTKPAIEYIKQNHTDLIFLNIKKSLQQGIHTIFNFKHKAMIILTSANRKFALEAFDHGAVDFLLKPVLYERFTRAVEKVHTVKWPKENTGLSMPQASLKGGFIFIKEGTKLIRVELDDIYYVMGLKNYVSIFVKSHRIVSLQTMKQIEELLPTNRFIRVHRSYFVAIDKIISIEKQQIRIKDKLIPIGNIYFPHFMKKLLGSNTR